jgi:hypothetical protein
MVAVGVFMLAMPASNRGDKCPENTHLQPVLPKSGVLIHYKEHIEGARFIRTSYIYLKLFQTAKRQVSTYCYSFRYST